MNSRFYEDYRVGEIVTAGGVRLSEAMIVSFAYAHDPQPFHLDPAAAEQSIYGGLIASGWQVGLIGFRMLLQAGLLGEGSMGSPGMDEMRWHLPARPGDTLYAEAEILGMRPSGSKPELGILQTAYRIHNQRHELVMSWHGIQLIRRRPALPPAPGELLPPK